MMGKICMDTDDNDILCKVYLERVWELINCKQDLLCLLLKELRINMR